MQAARLKKVRPASTKNKKRSQKNDRKYTQSSQFRALVLPRDRERGRISPTAAGGAASNRWREPVTHCCFSPSGAAAPGSSAGRESAAL